MVSRQRTEQGSAQCRASDGPGLERPHRCDLDCREAVRIGSYFLPKTTAVFGHASKPQSHFLYYTALVDELGTKGKAAEQFLDPNMEKGGTLLELRYGGNDKAAQTMAPGYVHPSGEPIEWVAGHNGDASPTDGLKLLKACKHLAAASLLGRYWPEHGQWHEAALRLGGFLARCSFTSEQAEEFAEAVALAAGAPESVEGNRREARDAVRANTEKKRLRLPSVGPNVRRRDRGDLCEMAELSVRPNRSDGADGNQQLQDAALRPLLERPGRRQHPDLHFGPIEILAETRDVSGYSWGLLLQWKDHDNQVKRWAMPKTLLKAEGVEVRGMLLDGGLDIAPAKKAREHFTFYLISQRSVARARAVPTIGWHGNSFRLSRLFDRRER